MVTDHSGRGSVDIALRNGLLIANPSSEPAREDIYIHGREVAAIGGPARPARLELDASGMLMIPGLNNLHDHLRDMTPGMAEGMKIDDLLRFLWTLSETAGATEYRLATALAAARRHATEMACADLATALCRDLQVPQVTVKVLAARPSHDWGELHGLYTRPGSRARPTVTVWMRSSTSILATLLSMRVPFVVMLTCRSSSRAAESIWAISGRRRISPPEKWTLRKPSPCRKRSISQTTSAVSGT